MTRNHSPAFPPWLILMGLLTALGPLAIDMYLPAFPAMLRKQTKGVFIGTLIGVLPAIAASRARIQSALQDAGRGTTAGPAQRRVRAALVVAAAGSALLVALSMSLLARRG